MANNPTTSPTRLVKSSPGRVVAPLPNFLIIGAMKAGTTGLYPYLRVHPHVFMASIKELDFFVGKANWKRGLEWYRKQFEGAGPEAIAVGEASTTCTKYPSAPGVPERMATVVPEARLIYVVRNPVDRIRSHYQHRVAVGAEREAFEKAQIFLGNREVLRLDTVAECAVSGIKQR